MLLLLVLLACPAEPAGEPAAPPPPACEPVSALVQSPRICLDLPEGYQPGEVGSGATGDVLPILGMDGTRRTFFLKGFGGTDVHFFEQQRQATLDGAARDPAARTGSTPDGRGSWVRYQLTNRMIGPHGETSAVVHYGMAVSRAPTGEVVWCRAETRPDEEPPPGLLDACASLRVQ